MSTETSMHSCSNYAQTKDANYPDELQYIVAIQELKEPNQRRAVLALYSWLHYLDDVVDSPTATTAEKLKEIQDLTAFFTELDHNSSVALSALNSRADRHFWTELLWAWQQNPSSNHRPYYVYLDALRDTAIWPREPVFHSPLDLERFNERFFKSIVEILSPSLFGDILQERDFARYDFLQHVFFRFMLGMQMVNLLMDVSEDVQHGQYWFPRTEGAGSPTHKLTAELFQKYYSRGLRYMAESEPLRNSAVVGNDVAKFFMGLHRIFVRLGAHLETQLANAPQL